MNIAFYIGRVIGRVITPRFAEKFLYHAVFQHEFKPLDELKPFDTREELWLSAAQRIQDSQRLLFLEFGVWQGYSIRYFSQHYTGPDSRFVGFDSFEGLPERWEDKGKGFFSTRGSMPDIADSRVSFVKGWFQNSVPEFLAQLDVSKFGSVLVHFDADLYSSTLYLLSAFYKKIPRYYFVFDEFPGDETRALYNFVQATGATVRFFGRTGRSMQVFGEIDHGTGVYAPGPMQVKAG